MLFLKPWFWVIMLICCMAFGFVVVSYFGVIVEFFGQLGQWFGELIQLIGNFLTPEGG